MNRNQRRAPRRKENSSRATATGSKANCASTLSPIRIKCKDKNVTVHNRCCYVRPERTDFGQSFKTRTASPENHNDLEPKCRNEEPKCRNEEQKYRNEEPKYRNKEPKYRNEEPKYRNEEPKYRNEEPKCRNDEPIRPNEQYQAILEKQYGFDPAMPPLKGLKKSVCDHSTKIDIQTDYANQMTGTSPAYVDRANSSQWQTVDNVDDIDKLLIDDDNITVIRERLPRHIFISEVPRVKIIAEKFSRYKKNNLELRRLDEKVVCVEYDIFDQSANDGFLKPAQRMRAFFSIKPVFDNDESENKEGGALPRLPSNIKQKFDILDDDLKKLTEKEIEIIDRKIEENNSYLEDLRRILKRKKVINAKKNKTSLDLQSLYEMAKRDGLTPGCDDSEVNFLSKAELQEVKDLILQRCASSVHGIRRRQVKRRKEKDSALDVGLISESIVAELLR